MSILKMRYKNLDMIKIKTYYSNLHDIFFMKYDTYFFLLVPAGIIEEQASHMNLSSVIDTPAYIDCPVMGVPTPEIRWYKDGTLINADYEPNIRYNIVSDNKKKFVNVYSRKKLGMWK